MSTGLPGSIATHSAVAGGGVAGPGTGHTTAALEPPSGPRISTRTTPVAVDNSTRRPGSVRGTAKAERVTEPGGGGAGVTGVEVVVAVAIVVLEGGSGAFGSPVQAPNATAAEARSSRAHRLNWCHRTALRAVV